MGTQALEKKVAVKTASELKLERTNQKKKLDRQTWILSTVVLILMLIVAGFYASSSKPRQLERRLTWGFQFEMRQWLKQAPTMDPRLKVLMFDDSTVQTLNRSSLNINEWASLLSFIDRHRPANVYIDKVFGLLDDTPSAVQDALQIFKSLRSPVSIAAFTNSLQIAGRDEVNLQAAQFSARQYLPNDLADIPEIQLEKEVKSARLKDRSKARIYGPIPQLQELFRIGQIDYPIPNQIFPVYDLGNKVLLPHLGLTGSMNLKLEKEGISSAGKLIPKSSEGHLLVNWLSPAQLYAQATPFASAFAAMKSGGLWDKLPEGSHILILPLAFTGNVDFKESPYGSVPGGFVIASTINSSLTKRWLKDFEYAPQIMFALVFMAGLLQFLKGMRSWLTLFLGVLVIAGIGLYQFIYASTDIPWLAGELFFAGTGTLLLSMRSFWDSRRERLLSRLEDDYERLEKEENRLQKEMRDAERVAQALRPDEIPDWPELEISAFHKSMTEASGDWYAFQKSPSGRFVHLVLCDISGHGVQAALVVSGCKTLFSVMRLNEESIFDCGDFLIQYATRLNSVLYLNGQGTHTATMTGLTFDLQNGKIHSIVCGHPFPTLFHQKGSKLESLTTFSNDPLGFSVDVNFKVQERTWLKGDCVFAYSDGIPLSRGRRILQKYCKEVEHGALIPAKRLVEAMMKQFRKDQIEVTEDDVTLVIIRKQA